MCPQIRSVTAVSCCCHRVGLHKVEALPLSMPPMLFSAACCVSMCDAAVRSCWRHPTEAGKCLQAHTQTPGQACWARIHPFVVCSEHRRDTCKWNFFAPLASPAPGCQGCAAGGGRWRCSASTRSSRTGRWRSCAQEIGEFQHEDRQGNRRVMIMAGHAKLNAMQGSCDSQLFV